MIIYNFPFCDVIVSFFNYEKYSSTFSRRSNSQLIQKMFTIFLLLLLFSNEFVILYTCLLKTIRKIAKEQRPGTIRLNLIQ